VRKSIHDDSGESSAHLSGKSMHFRKIKKKTKQKNIEQQTQANTDTNQTLFLIMKYLWHNTSGNNCKKIHNGTGNRTRL